MESDVAITFWFAAARAVHFAACLAILSVLAFDRIVIPREILRDSPGVRRLWEKIVAWVLGLALPVAAFSAIAWFIVVTIDVTDLLLGQAIKATMLRLVFTHTRFGTLWQLRAGIWLATLVAVSGAAAARGRLRGALIWSATCLAAVLVGSLAWSGHGQNGQPAQWHLLADVVHLLVCGLWPIGLLPMSLLLLGLRRSDLPNRWTITSRVVNRFSAISLCAVVLLAASGLVNSCYLLDSAWDLVRSFYGRVLLAKILLFLLLVGIGAWNLFRIKPHLASSPRDAGQLQWTMGAELALATAVVVVVAVLGTLPLPQG